MRLGELLVRLGLVTEAQVATALTYQARWNCRLGEALVHLRVLTPEQVLRARSRQLGVPFVRGEAMAKVPAAVVASVAPEVLARLKVCPLRADWHGTRGTLYVATHQPEDLARLDDLAFVTNFTVRPVLALLEDIERTLRWHGVSGPRELAPIELPPDEGTRLEITRGVELQPERL
ncbi:pilus assembly protein PilB [Pyxidicoccus fallax]|uniref:Pilus assembly protein PilB n=1 Tax=Pyxidicoccus fallax TaxID=394095 RepID=A0A848LXC3_9BACT|nr:pilus assembly protein PilB [Pyxidicoccus fallax]NMO22279.1 pilus assembly protein PilB [Pyxidicoccus fallax]NPC84097.1 pilus assembly protein PilB [Pyxidicoccus fallax]